MYLDRYGGYKGDGVGDIWTEDVMQEVDKFWDSVDRMGRDMGVFASSEEGREEDDSSLKYPDIDPRIAKKEWTVQEVMDDMQTHGGMEAAFSEELKNDLKLPDVPSSEFERDPEGALSEWNRQAQRPGFILSHRTALERHVPAYLLPAGMQDDSDLDMHGKQSAWEEWWEEQLGRQARVFPEGSDMLAQLQRDVSGGLVEGSSDPYLGAVRAEVGRIGADELERRVDLWAEAQRGINLERRQELKGIQEVSVPKEVEETVDRLAEWDSARKKSMRPRGTPLTRESGMETPRPIESAGGREGGRIALKSERWESSEEERRDELEAAEDDTGRRVLEGIVADMAAIDDILETGGMEGGRREGALGAMVEDALVRRREEERERRQREKEEAAAELTAAGFEVGESDESEVIRTRGGVWGLKHVLKSTPKRGGKTDSGQLEGPWVYGEPLNWNLTGISTRLGHLVMGEEGPDAAITSDYIDNVTSRFVLDPPWGANAKPELSWIASEEPEEGWHLLRDGDQPVEKTMRELNRASAGELERARQRWQGADLRWLMWGLYPEVDGVFGEPTAQQRLATRPSHPILRVVQAREELFARLWRAVDGDIERVSHVLRNDPTCPMSIHLLARLERAARKQEQREWENRHGSANEFQIGDDEMVEKQGAPSLSSDSLGSLDLLSELSLKDLEEEQGQQQQQRDVIDMRQRDAEMRDGDEDSFWGSGSDEHDAEAEGDSDEHEDERLADKLIGSGIFCTTKAKARFAFLVPDALNCDEQLASRGDGEWSDMAEGEVLQRKSEYDGPFKELQDEAIRETAAGLVWSLCCYDEFPCHSSHTTAFRYHLALKDMTAMLKATGSWHEWVGPGRYFDPLGSFWRALVRSLYRKGKLPEAWRQAGVEQAGGQSTSGTEKSPGWIGTPGNARRVGAEDEDEAAGQPIAWRFRSLAWKEMEAKRAQGRGAAAEAREARQREARLWEEHAELLDVPVERPPWGEWGQFEGRVGKGPMLMGCDECGLKHTLPFPGGEGGRVGGGVHGEDYGWDEILVGHAAAEAVQSYMQSGAEDDYEKLFREPDAVEDGVRRSHLQAAAELCQVTILVLEATTSGLQVHQFPEVESGAEMGEEGALVLCALGQHFWCCNDYSPPIWELLPEGYRQNATRLEEWERAVKASLNDVKGKFWSQEEIGEDEEDVEEEEAEGDAEMEEKPAERPTVNLLEEEVLTEKDRGWLEGLATWHIGLEAQEKGERYDSWGESGDEGEDQQSSG